MLDPRSLILATLLPLAAQPADNDSSGSTSHTADIVLDLRGLRNGQGHVYALVHNSARGFPGERSRAVAQAQVKAEPGHTIVLFTGVPVGEYAVALFHDENGNRSLDTNWLGIPTEGIATSNNAQSRVGPPTFRRAKFVLSESGFRQVVQIRYY